MSNNVEAPVLMIRECELRDAEAVTGLMREVSYPTTTNVMKERIEGLESNPNACMLVAEVDEQIIGVIGLQCVQSHAYPEPAAQITSLIVGQEHRGSGIGRRLMARAEAWGKKQGGKQLFVTGANREVTSTTYSFYEHIGFQKRGYRFSKVLL
ncbi:GNAT family N-acetyltransferase [Paenibacillus sp. TSA_86.1]|uniref:GNAT family N-acetyltransferase n=1 Tax=Paenibacillus sp. TSA_86.1 TaxID=3415649 RepID=UPI0040457969